jgi:pSer/pThr/pTyr-binding forkhead associated (FHA) protein
MTTPSEASIVVHLMAGVNDTIVIGSAEDCDVQIVGDGYVSAHHAKIVRAVRHDPVNGVAGICEIFDLGSTNDTWIRREPDLMLRVGAGGFITLQPGDVIQVGKTRIPWSGEVDYL